MRKPFQWFRLRLITLRCAAKLWLCAGLRASFISRPYQIQYWMRWRRWCVCYRMVTSWEAKECYPWNVNGRVSFLVWKAHATREQAMEMVAWRKLCVFVCPFNVFLILFLYLMMTSRISSCYFSMIFVVVTELKTISRISDLSPDSWSLIVHLSTNFCEQNNSIHLS